MLEQGSGGQDSGHDVGECPVVTAPGVVLKDRLSQLDRVVERDPLVLVPLGAVRLVISCPQAGALTAAEQQRAACQQ